MPNQWPFSNLIFKQCCPIPSPQVEFIFLMNETFHLRNFKHSSCANFGCRKPKEFQQHKLHCRKVTVWCTLHANSGVTSYFIENDPVRGINNYQELDKFVYLQAQQSPRDAVFRQDKSSSQTTCALLFLYERFWNSLTGKFCVALLLARSPISTPLDVSSGYSWQIKCIGLLYLTYRNFNWG